MHRDVARIGVENIEARANRILPMPAATDDVAHLLQRGRTNECLQLREPIWSPNQDDFINRICPLESIERVRHDRLVPPEGEQFIEPPPLAAAPRDNNDA